MDGVQGCDLPQEGEWCSFIKVSGCSMTHIFIWFCAVHHVCYGFHMIDGSEGREDPMYSIYSYLKA